MIGFKEWREVNRRAREQGTVPLSRVEASALLEIRAAQRSLSGEDLVERLGITRGQAWQALKCLTAAGLLDEVPK